MVDKALLKMLIPSLGRKAALRLADPADPYFIGIIDGYADADQQLSLSVGTTFSISQDVSPAVQQVETSLCVPVVAGGVIVFQHTVFGVSQPHPNRLLALKIVKMADADGIPVAPVETTLSATRTAGVITRPASVTGFTVAAGAAGNAGFQVTIATAGHYLVKAGAYA